MKWADTVAHIRILTIMYGYQYKGYSSVAYGVVNRGQGTYIYEATSAGKKTNDSKPQPIIRYKC
jgi:hypothetical protein